MITIKILKNGNTIRQFTCPAKMKQKYFKLAFDMAGGMWNGKDEFNVLIS
jgi:hypothetical protein